MSNLTVVRFNPKTVAVEIQANFNYVYEIDLEERCSNAEKLLDTLLQVEKKTWCTPEMFRDVIKCFRDTAWLLFGETLQGLICPWGKSQFVDWKKATRSGKRFPEPNIKVIEGRPESGFVSV
jgi:hypothetical protein